MGLTPAEMALQKRLAEGVESFENYFDNSADAPIITKSPESSLGRAGVPQFSAQFDVQILIKYFTLTSGTYTAIAASALDAGLKTYIPFFLFGLNDYLAGFPKARTNYPLTANWTYGIPGIYGKDDFYALAFDSNVTALLQNGDLIIVFTSALPGSGTTTLALIILRCTQVAYGTLLNALNSDRFVMNYIRYALADATQVAQFAYQIGIFKQSLFGKSEIDYISPNSYKDPKNYQAGIIDIPLKYGVDKNRTLGSYNLYTNVDMTWSIFVWTTKKLQV